MATSDFSVPVSSPCEVRERRRTPFTTGYSSSLESGMSLPHASANTPYTHTHTQNACYTSARPRQLYSSYSEQQVPRNWLYNYKRKSPILIGRNNFPLRLRHRRKPRDITHCGMPGRAAASRRPPVSLTSCMSSSWVTGIGSKGWACASGILRPAERSISRRTLGKRSR